MARALALRDAESLPHGLAYPRGHAVVRNAAVECPVLRGKPTLATDGKPISSASASGRRRSESREQLIWSIRYGDLNPVVSDLASGRRLAVEQPPRNCRILPPTAIPDHRCRPRALPILTRRSRSGTYRAFVDSDGAATDMAGALTSATDCDAYARMTASTSSRFRSISSCERASRLRRSSGSVFDGRTLKCQSSASTETPSRCETSPSRPKRSFSSCELQRDVGDGRVDLAGDEVALAERREDLRQLPAALRDRARA